MPPLIIAAAQSSSIAGDLAAQGFQQRGVLHLDGLELTGQTRGAFAGGGGFLRDRVV